MAMTESSLINDRSGRWRRSGGVVSDIIVMILIVVAIVGAANGKPFVAALCGFVLVVAFISRLWTRLALVEVEYDCTPSGGRMVEGDRVDLVLTIENNKPLPLPWLTVSELAPAGLRLARDAHLVFGQFRPTEIKETVGLGQYQRLTIRHSVIGARRGIYAFGPTKIVSGDIFGFYEARRDVPKRSPSLIVYPRTVPLPDFELPSLRPIGDAWSRSRLAEDPTRPNGVREYRTGDPMRRIDWKTTARRGEVFVRTYDPSVSQRVVIMLDCNVRDPRDWSERVEVLESIVVGAASVALRSVELGYAVGLVSNGISTSAGAPAVVTPSAGPGQLPALMTSLAGASSMASRSIQSLVTRFGAEAIPTGATIVYIAGVFHSGTVEYVVDLARRGHRIRALYAGNGAPPELPNLPIEDCRALFSTNPEEPVEAERTHV